MNAVPNPVGDVVCDFGARDLGAIAATAPIAVAMSGGIDSSVAACLLADLGVPVVGLSMLLWDRSHEAARGRCCGSLDLADARRVAHQIGIPHYTLRMDSEFRRDVVDPFIDDYLGGRTPSPCIRCNTFVKFDLLVERARRLGAQRLATGHYARIVEGADGWELHAARDQAKDQSYYLFELTQEQLGQALFPLGELTKVEVREHARSRGLVVAEKGESFEVCFVADGVKDFVEGQIAERTERPERTENTKVAAASPPAITGAEIAGAGAEIVDDEGRLLGNGDPYYRYTVGQRRGLGVSSGQRLYVLGVDPEHNRVRVGPRQALDAVGLCGERLHWIGRPPEGEVEATVKIRSRHPGVQATIRPQPGRRVSVRFHERVAAVAPGQAAVFYDGTRVLGGCWIESGIEPTGLGT